MQKSDIDILCLQKENIILRLNLLKGEICKIIFFNVILRKKKLEGKEVSGFYFMLFKLFNYFF